MNPDSVVQNINPLVDPPPAEVKLVRAPLSLVVTQFRFAPIMKIEDQSYIASFQEQVRGEYPLLAREQLNLNVALGDGSQPVSNTRTIWRMTSIDGAWRLILSQEFVALETTDYLSRADFLDRWKRILGAFAANIHGVAGLRYGLRYVNRIEGSDLVARIPELVRKEALGVASLLPPAGVSLTESVFKVAEGTMLARWGFLPANTTHDMAITATPHPSWVLDYDLFVEGLQSGAPLGTDDVLRKAEEFCHRGYAFFRWMTTPAFLDAFGRVP